MVTQERYLSLFNESISSLESLNEKETNGLKWDIDKDLIELEFYKGFGTNGWCEKKDNNKKVIKINYALDKEEEIKNTMIHELLHSYDDTFKDGHKGRWLERVYYVKKYLGILITRTSKKHRDETLLPKRVTYEIVCPNCGVLETKHRKTYYMTSNNKCSFVSCKQCNSEDITWRIKI